MDNSHTVESIASLIRNFVPKNANVPTEEGDNLASLVVLFLNPSKNLNPRDIMRKMSDPIIEHIIKNRSRMPEHPVMKMIFRLFLIEWCYRNGYMKEDWNWVWNESGKSGQASMNMEVSMDKIPLPSL